MRFGHIATCVLQKSHGHITYDMWNFFLGQVEKQDMSGNKREREYESETADHIMVVMFLRATSKGWTNSS